MRIWLAAMQRDHRLFDGRILTMVSPEVESYAPCGTPCGAESGHAYKNIPKAINSLYSCPYDVYEIKDYEAKYYCLLRITAGQSISLIYTCNPSTVLLLASASASLRSRLSVMSMMERFRERMTYQTIFVTR